MKYHIPSPHAVGLSGIALCGRWAHYGTGDHAHILRAMRQSIATNDTDDTCRQCLAVLTMRGRPVATDARVYGG